MFPKKGVTKKRQSGKLPPLVSGGGVEDDRPERECMRRGKDSQANNEGWTTNPRQRMFF